MKKRTMLALAVLVSGCAWAARPACGRQTEAAKGTTMSAKNQFFSQVEAMVGLKTIDKEPVAKALKSGLDFELVSEDEYFAEFEAKPSGSAFRRVEVRAPRGENRGGLVILELSAGLKLRPKDVAAHFGDEFGIKGPNARQPANSPYYHVYKRPSGLLKFGFAPAGNPYLVEVIWDRAD